jgi:hypothetical protein
MRRRADRGAQQGEHSLYRQERGGESDGLKARKRSMHELGRRAEQLRRKQRAHHETRPALLGGAG